MAILITGNECDFVALARTTYEKGDDIVRTLNHQKKNSASVRKSLTTALRGYLSDIEDYLWQALARDYPQFRYRRQGQTIVVDYNGGGQSITIQEGEVYKIKSWGHNEYYEALDTINRLQGRMLTITSSQINRKWHDNWRRLDRQINIIYERNCAGRPEPSPGPDPIVCPPMNPVPTPYTPVWPLPLVAYAGMWSLSDQRNWGVTGWSMSGSTIPGVSGIVWYNAPSIVKIEGRELVFYSPSATPTKLVWLFHGNGGSARSWFTDYEKIKYVKKFLDAGYAVAAYESYNRISRKWAPSVNPDTNREIKGLLACQDFLASIGILRRVATVVSTINPYTLRTTQTTTYSVVGVTQYGVGMSAGGGMVSYAAGAMGLRKIAIHNAAGIDSVIQNAAYAADTLWMVSANDIVFGNSDANANYNYLVTNRPSLTVAYYSQAGTKITSAIFDDIPSVSGTVADAIVAGLYAGGFTNVDGTLTTKYSIATRAVRDQYLQATIPTIVSTAFGNDQDTYRKYANDIMDQIKISFSDHEFSGWQRSESVGSLVLTDRDLAFFG
jgi:hypothetical protein